MLPWQPGDLMVTYTLASGAWVTLRASGTEPKLKIYLEASKPGEADVLAAAVEQELVQPAVAGLARPQR